MEEKHFYLLLTEIEVFHVIFITGKLL